jgi:hypothetical protein
MLNRLNEFAKYVLIILCGVTIVGTVAHLGH